MATRSSACTMQGQTAFTNSLGSYDMSSSKYAGYVSGDGNYWVCIIKFKTPKFSGISEKLTLKIGIRKQVSEECKLRYALCASDKNYSKYIKTTGTVSDSTQIKTGTLTASGLTSSFKKYTIEVNTEDLNKETTYYLYLWSASTYTGSYALIDAAKNHAFTLVYRLTGGGRICTAAGTVKMFPAVIYTANGWRRFVPMVYTADGWKRKS